MSSSHHFFGCEPSRLREVTVELGLPAYRCDQLLNWVYQNQVTDPDQMINLPKQDRQLLASAFRFTTSQIVTHQQATDEVQKLLLRWEEPGPGAPGGPGEAECVLIPTPHRKTACISSQIGCPVGCRFCASGLDGLVGNLQAGQMVEQVWRLRQLPPAKQVTHVVFMGMGEPLANFEQVVTATRILTDPKAMQLSARHITISTVGLPSQIKRLADLRMPVTLAISLHAPNDPLRQQLIPWANRVTIDQLIDAGRYFFSKTGREVTLEYVLLRGVNDRPHHAKELGAIAKQLRSNVNLIRYNEVEGLPFARPITEDVLRFQRLLRQANINCHIRASRGRDVAAACGQLRRKSLPRSASAAIAEP